MHFDDLPRLDEEEFLNDSLIDFYMMFVLLVMWTYAFVNTVQFPIQQASGSVGQGVFFQHLFFHSAHEELGSTVDELQSRRTMDVKDRYLSLRLHCCAGQ